MSVVLYSRTVGEPIQEAMWFGSQALCCALLASMGASAASIEGSVVITKRLTKRKVTASADAYARGVSVDLRSDSAEEVLNAERTRVVVYLEAPGLSRKAAPVTAEITQTNRQFTPDTITIPAGSTVSFPNFDPIFHNVFSLSKPKMFDLGNYPKGQTRLVQFPNPGVVFVHCHLHPNMAAAILVAPTKFTTVADRNGKFQFQDLPPGEYTAVAWHRGAGFFRQTVKVTAGDAKGKVNFVLPLDIPQPKAALADAKHH